MKYDAVVKGGRVKLLEAMNEIIIAVNDEEAYERWTYVVPDEADHSDFVEIAEDDDLYRDVCKLFRKLLSSYGKSGFYVTLDNEAF